MFFQADAPADLTVSTRALDQVLAEGAARASAVAEATLADVYDRVGFVRPGGK